jgi:hypothetical protein
VDGHRRSSEGQQGAAGFGDRPAAIERACEKRLVRRTPAEIVRFSVRQWHLRDHTYRYDLWAAAHLIEG